MEKSDLLLQALDAAALDDEATAVKVSDFIIKDAVCSPTDLSRTPQGRALVFDLSQITGLTVDEILRL